MPLAGRKDSQTILSHFSPLMIYLFIKHFDWRVKFNAMTRNKDLRRTRNHLCLNKILKYISKKINNYKYIWALKIC